MLVNCRSQDWVSLTHALIHSSLLVTVTSCFPLTLPVDPRRALEHDSKLCSHTAQDGGGEWGRKPAPWPYLAPWPHPAETSYSNSPFTQADSLWEPSQPHLNILFNTAETLQLLLKQRGTAGSYHYFPGKMLHPLSQLHLHILAPIAGAMPLLFPNSCFVVILLTLPSVEEFSLGRGPQASTPLLEGSSNKPKYCATKVQLGEPVNLWAYLPSIGELTAVYVTPKQLHHCKDSYEYGWLLIAA